jgi:hypothetical protein
VRPGTGRRVRRSGAGALLSVSGTVFAPFAFKFE